MGMKIITVKFPTHLLNEVDKQANINNITRSEYIRESVKAMLTGHCTHPLSPNTNKHKIIVKRVVLQ